MTLQTRASKRRPLRWLAASAGTAATLATLWACTIEPRLLDECELEVELPALGRGWDGQRIVLLADLQIGILFGNTGTARRAVRRAVELEPAAALLAGDFVYEAVCQPEPALRRLAAVLSPFRQAGLATYAVLGNHDYGEEGTRRERLQLAQRVRSVLEDLGIRVLENEALPIPTGAADDPLYVAGIGPHIPHRDDPARAMDQVPRGCPRLVLMHNPTSFAELPACSAPLALAGHTHGGQLRLPFLPSWTLGRLTVPWPEYLSGWIDGLGQPGNHIYVNRGIGFSRYPLRFCCPPELTVITLRSPNR